jgi:methylated-DNA-[protein]-cysteine S-methyltransferase
VQRDPVTLYTELDSPLGPLLAARDAAGITALLLPSGRRAAQPAAAWSRHDTAFDDLRAQLAEYFAGSRTSFELPLHLLGSPFQQRVWRALCEIPCGETRSYREIAIALGKPTATRAVGAANGQNPVAIVVPCHRVIGANGSLTGYGGGLDAKRWLLAHEAQHTGLFATT